MFDPVFRQDGARQIPGQLGLLVLEETPGNRLGVPGVDLCASRAGGAEGNPAKLQLGRSGPRAFLDEFKCEILGLLILVFRQHLEAVDDRADRADQIVADARAKQRGKIKGFKIGRGHGELFGS
jgi:hypothetical protein